MALVGAIIDAPAVRVTKADQGYYVTPIEQTNAAGSKAQVAGTQGMSKDARPAGNTLQNVFGI